jgi:hypothetical protein
VNTNPCCKAESTPEFDLNRCTKGFSTLDEARRFMVERRYAGHVLLREGGSFTAVCLAYPDGFYPDATIIETIEAPVTPPA